MSYAVRVFLFLALTLATAFSSAWSSSLDLQLENPDAVLPLTTSLNFNPLKDYVKWTQGSSYCFDCAIKVVATNPLLLKNDVYYFLSTLGDVKSELQDLYGIHGQEYNLLAQMAVGILGRESMFFNSARYKLKESVPSLVALAKGVVALSKGRESNSNSRGPTQIKIVPIKIQERYGIQAGDLQDPRKAAISTMGFLINSLQELRKQVRVKKLTFITKDKIVDYLPYIYFGAARAIYNKTAKPEANAYVQEMKKYMKWVQVYEYHPELCGTDN